MVHEEEVEKNRSQIIAKGRPLPGDQSYLVDLDHLGHTSVHKEDVENNHYHC